MTASSVQSARIAPMPAGRRFSIATASSVGFHLVVLIAIGLLAGRPQPAREVLIPIELAMAAGPQDSLTLGGGGHPEAEVATSSSPAVAPEPVKKPASSPGGKLEAAPAAPKVLTAKTGKEPAGPVGEGRDAAGPGGKEDVPSGPTYGAGIVGGPLPVYPKDAMDQGIQGTVSLSVVVAEDGSVKSAVVAKSSGHALLDDAALRAVKEGWLFKAGMEKGKPATGKLTVTIVFSAGTVKKG